MLSLSCLSEDHTHTLSCSDLYLSTSKAPQKENQLEEKDRPNLRAHKPRQHDPVTVQSQEGATTSTEDTCRPRSSAPSS